MTDTVFVRSTARLRTFHRAARIWLLAALFGTAAIVTARAGSLADLDHDNGLPDAQLGAPLKSFQGLQKTEDTGRWLSYIRPPTNRSSPGMR